MTILTLQVLKIYSPLRILNLLTKSVISFIKLFNKQKNIKLNNTLLNIFCTPNLCYISIKNYKKKLNFKN